MKKDWGYLSIEDRWREETFNGIATGDQIKAIKQMIAEPVKGHFIEDKDTNQLLGILWDLRVSILTSQMSVDEVRTANKLFEKLVVETYKAIGFDITAEE